MNRTLIAELPGRCFRHSRPLNAHLLNARPLKWSLGLLCSTLLGLSSGCGDESTPSDQDSSGSGSTSSTPNSDSTSSTSDDATPTATSQDSNTSDSTATTSATTSASDTSGTHDTSDSTTSDSSSDTESLPDRCHQPPNEEECWGTAIERWAYDAAQDRCLPFIWRGCEPIPYADLHSCTFWCHAQSLTEQGNKLEKCNLSPIDAVTIKDLRVDKDDALVVKFAVSGGCRSPDAYRLCWSEELEADGKDLKATATLIYDGQGDPCDAIEEKEATFDIKSLIKAADGKDVELHIGEKSVEID